MVDTPNWNHKLGIAYCYIYFFSTINNISVIWWRSVL